MKRMDVTTSPFHAKPWIVESSNNTFFVASLAGSIGILFFTFVLIVFRCLFCDQHREVVVTEAPFQEHSYTEVDLSAARNYVTLASGIRATRIIAPSPISSREDLSPKCCVCIVGRVKVVIDDCGHMCLCSAETCLNTAGTKCPICRNDIKKFITVYKS